MMNRPILVEFVPIEEQRYDTAGDYYEGPNCTHFKITKQKDWRSEIAILLHEICEYYLCKNRGLSEEEITMYDLGWEVLYNLGLAKTDEPGMEKNCPYRDEHETSLMVEKIFCMAAGVDWKKHDEQIIFRQDVIRDQE